MFIGLLICAVYLLFCWVVFGWLKLLKFNALWAFVSVLIGVHLLLIFLIGLRFVTPYSTNAKFIQHTIQLIPRLTEPTLVTKVWVENNKPVKKGDKLFEFDRRPYEYKVNALKAQLAEAEQHVLELKAQLDAAISSTAQAKAQQITQKAAYDSAVAELDNAQAERKLAHTKLDIADEVARENPNAISKLRLDQARAELAEAEAAVRTAQADEVQARVNYEQVAAAAIKVAQANEQKARLAYTSQIDGENTTVAQLKANLAGAQYYLDNTTMLAPEDGTIINLQVQPGMVSGILRAGAIASLIVDRDRYLLATYYQENLKWVEVGQPVEIALDLYPGQIFQGKVEHIWRASRKGQMLPSGDLPNFYSLPDAPQGQFAVQINLDDSDQSKFPIGTQGAAAIYTNGLQGGWAALRRIGIRARAWLLWLYPLNF